MSLFLVIILIFGTFHIQFVRSDSEQVTYSISTSHKINQNQLVTSNVTNKLENEVASQIYDIIDHFKKDDPVGLPIPIPDPIQIPQIEEKKFMTTLKMNPVYLHDISKFRIKSASIELDKLMQASIELSYDVIRLNGNYSLRNFAVKADGPFITIIKNLNVKGAASLAVDSNGKLRSQDIELDMKVASMNVTFENLGGLAKPILSKLVNTGDDSFFNMIKPYIINDMKVTIKKIIDEKIDENLSSSMLLPNSIGAVDFAIAEGRKLVKEKFDHFVVDDIESVGVFGYRVYDTELFGISSFYRVGDIKTTIENKKAVINLNIGTQEIHGKTTWEVSVARGMISRSGRVQFTVQYLKVNLKVSQPLDLSKKLKIDDLEIDLGNIQILSSGLGTFDYAIEFILNILPNLLRHQIMDVIRKPVIERIHQYTNRIDAESLVKEKVNEYFTTGAVSMDFKFNNEL